MQENCRRCSEDERTEHKKQEPKEMRAGVFVSKANGALAV